jgi:NAD(P)-dependent dehydrogenase (short-subunit alcohol dehydrogenase family)
MSVVMITGAPRGIGAESALDLAAAQPVGVPERGRS